ncbi:response regulator transcription factor [Luteolibacter soli]|uniref:Response regulator transcription factor n=1 Tax=Luteolibacter soli TaxID=3135280 RepID=A0ABU9B1S0_9BACT
MNLFRTPIHVGIVESNRGILSELQQLINEAGNLRCVCASTSGEDALERIPQARPHVVIMGLGLAGICGIECTVRLKRILRETQVLIYSSQSAEQSVSRAFQAGAGGYLLKHRDHSAIVQGVLDLVDGGAPMTGEVARKVVQSLWRTEARSLSDLLTPREEEILGCLTSGLVNKEIGDRLAVSCDTVRYHLKNIYAKLSVRTRTEAVVKYLSSTDRHPGDAEVYPLPLSPLIGSK